MNDDFLMALEATEQEKYMDLIRSLKSDSDRFKRVEGGVDRTLRQRLSKIFRERCLSSSSQIEEFVRAPGLTELNSIIDLLLKQTSDTVLRRHFSKEQLSKLSLLWIAVLGYYHESAELLVRSGADVNEPFGRQDPQLIDEKWTVMYVLLQMYPSSGNERLIRLAVDHGADLQAQDSKGKTVLHFAVRESRVQLTEMLLEKGADVNAADDSGVTSVFEAAVNNSKAGELLQLTMKYGADVFAKDTFDHNILHLLSRGLDMEYADLARDLIEMGVSLDDRDCELYQPLHRATIAGHNELVKLYLDHGADVHALAYDGNSSLHLVARYGYTAVIKTLLKRGADVNLRTTTEGHTVLHCACESSLYHHNDDENIGLLLSAGADVLSEDYNGKTPFALMMINHEYMEDLIGLSPRSSIRLILKMLALIKVCQPSIELKDERLIEGNQKLWDYYRDCIEEIERMKFTSFIKRCTFFDLLTKCHCEIAALVRNPEFEINFKNYDLSEFPAYAEDIVRAFERAQNNHKSMLEQEDVISEAVYNTLPYVIVRKVVYYMFMCCENVRDE